MKARALRSTILVSQKVPARRRAEQPTGSRPGPGGDPGSALAFPAFRLLSDSSGAAIAGPPVRMCMERHAPGRPAQNGRPVPSRLATPMGGERAPPAGRTASCSSEGKGWVPGGTHMYWKGADPFAHSLFRQPVLQKFPPHFPT